MPYRRTRSHTAPAAPCAAFARTLTDHAAETEARGYAALAASHRALLATLPYEADAPNLPRYVLTRRGRYALAMVGCIVACVLSLMGLTPTAAMGATPVHAQGTPMPATCYEDMPCFEWSTMGNMQRGVILVSAPKRCTWDTYGKGCTTVVDPSQYCALRKAGRIDRKRTPSLKGDGLARDRGCDPRYFAQDA